MAKTKVNENKRYKRRKWLKGAGKGLKKTN